MAVYLAVGAEWLTLTDREKTDGECFGVHLHVCVCVSGIEKLLLWRSCNSKRRTNSNLGISLTHGVISLPLLFLFSHAKRLMYVSELSEMSGSIIGCRHTKPADYSLLFVYCTVLVLVSLRQPGGNTSQALQPGILWNWKQKPTYWSGLITSLFYSPHCWG